MWKIYATSGRTYLLIVEADKVLPYYTVKFNRYFFKFRSGWADG